MPQPRPMRPAVVLTPRVVEYHQSARRNFPPVAGASQLPGSVRGQRAFSEGYTVSMRRIDALRKCRSGAACQSTSAAEMRGVGMARLNNSGPASGAREPSLSVRRYSPTRARRAVARDSSGKPTLAFLLRAPRRSQTLASSQPARVVVRCRLALRRSQVLQAAARHQERHRECTRYWVRWDLPLNTLDARARLRPPENQCLRSDSSATR